MTIATWTTFLLTALVIVVTPGTGSLYTVATGLARGPRAAVLAAFACTLGTLPHLLAAITGLAALLNASGVAFAVLKYAGVLDDHRMNAQVKTTIAGIDPGAWLSSTPATSPGARRIDRAQSTSCYGSRLNTSATNPSLSVLEDLRT